MVKVLAHVRGLRQLIRKLVNVHINYLKMGLNFIQYYFQTGLTSVNGSIIVSNFTAF